MRPETAHISWHRWATEIDAFGQRREALSAAAALLSRALRQTQGIGIDANICVRREAPTVRLPEAVRAGSSE